MPNWKKVAVSGSSPEFNNITASGHIDITGAGSSPLTDGVRLGVQSDKLQIYTDNGYVSIGPAKSGFSHFYTDRTKFYFNKQVIVDSGFVSSYNEDLTLRRNYSSSDNEITLGHNMMSMSQGGNVVFTMNAGNITSSGNISASGTIEANGDFIVNSIGRVGINTTSPDYKLDVAGNVGVNEYIYHNGDPNTYLRYQADQVDLSAGGNVATLNVNGFSLTSITASNDITSSEKISGKLIVSDTMAVGQTTTQGPFSFNYGDPTSLSNGEGYGEIISHLPCHTSVVAGDVVCNLGNMWRGSAHNSANVINQIGVALESGDSSTPAKVLVKGMVRLVAGHIEDSGGDEGDPLYMGATQEKVQFAVPGSGNYARIIGYCVNESNDIIFLDPDKTWVEVT